MSSKLTAEQIGSFVKAFLNVAEMAERGELSGEGFEQLLGGFYNELLEVFTTDGEIELRFGDGVIYLNSRKIRLSGGAGHRLGTLLGIAENIGWTGIVCDEIPNEDQVTAVLGRFSDPDMPSNHPALLRRIGPFRWLDDEAVDDQLGGASMPLDLLSQEAPETSMMRKVQIKDITEALGEDGGVGLEEVTFVYARAVYFVDRFMSTMEASGPRVPLDEASRIVCELVDAWASDPKSILAMSMARPQMGNYDAFHQANTALLSVALGGAIGLPHATLFELGLAGLLHQVGIVDMPDRIRYNRVLQKEEREILAQLPYRTVRRLLQAHGPDLDAMARLNAILAMKDPVAQKAVNSEGKARLVPINPKPPLMARILSVTARYDALTSDREFRKAMDPKKAITLMLRQPLALDGALVRLLAKMQNVTG